LSPSSSIREKEAGQRGGRREGGEKRTITATLVVLVLAVVVDGDDLGLVDCKRREAGQSKGGKKRRGARKRRTLLVVSVDLDRLVAVLAEVELDVVLVLLEAVKEEDGLAVVC
jgi:hypothetical protein